MDAGAETLVQQPGLPKGMKTYQLYYWFRINVISAWIVFALILALVIALFIEVTYLVIHVQPVVTLLSPGP